MQVEPKREKSFISGPPLPFSLPFPYSPLDFLPKQLNKIPHSKREFATLYTPGLGTGRTTPLGIKGCETFHANEMKDIKEQWGKQKLQTDMIS